MNHRNRRSRTATEALVAILLWGLVPGPLAGGAELYDPPRYCDSVALRADASLRAIDFRNSQLGVAVGAHGAILRTEDGGKTWQQVESTIPYQLDDVAFLDDARVIAVGGAYDPITRFSRGVVVFSSDGGRQWWRAADQELPRLRSIRIRPEDGAPVAAGDWSAVSLHREFESRDGGRTWNSTGELDGPVTETPEPTSQDQLQWFAQTRIPVAIRDAVRTKAGVIWAVGDHGVILTQTDSAEPWRVSRGAGNQTAVLMISGAPTRVAWPLLGREALEAGNRAALVLLQQREVPQRDATFSSLDLVRQAAAGMAVSAVDTMNTDSDEETRKRAAIWMVIHRPAVVLIDGELDQQTRTVFSEAAIKYGAQRVISYSLQARGGNVLHHTAMLPRTGTLASDLRHDAFRLIAPEDWRAESIALRSLYDAGTSKVRGNTVTSGLRLTRGQGLAAQTEPAARRQLQIAQARISHPKQTENLIHHSQTENEFAKALKSLLDQTAKSDQQRLAWLIYQTVAAAGPELADVSAWNRAVLTELETRFEGSSLAWYASLRLQAINNSDEWRRLRAAVANSPSQSPVRTASAEVVAVSPFQVGSDQVAQASASVPLKIVDTTPVNATPQIIRPDYIDLNWEFHPLALVTREAARRRGDDDQLQTPGGISANLRRLLGASQGAWPRLLRYQGSQVLPGRQAMTPPRLDGKLDEPCWPSPLPAAGSQQRVGCAYDEQFLYLAIITPENSFRDDADLPVTDQVRDHDLSAADRISVSIDTDTDLMTSLNLQFTRRGRTHDSIDGYPQWQPTWYVASQQADGNVITELAILRRDLVDLPIVAGQSWFLNTKAIPSGQPTFFQTMPTPNDWKRIVFVHD